MKVFKSVTKTDAARLCIFAAFQLFNLVSLVTYTVLYIQNKATVTQILMCVFSALFVSIPDIAQKLCRFRIATPMYVFVLSYALCPMLGHTYGLYYTIKWWDKLLHVTGGVVFALFGAYLPKLFLKDENCNMWLCVLFGFVFSIAIAGLWEFVEYFCDTFFHTDMQKDTIVYTLNSYLLNDILGGDLGTIERVGEVGGTLINGDMQVQGYLDIGKIDTMRDMLVEAAGALVFCIVYAVDKGKHTAFHYIPKPVEPNEE